MKKLVFSIFLLLFISCESAIQAELLSAASLGEDPRLELLGMVVDSIGTDEFSVSITYGNDANRNSTGIIYYCNETNVPDCDPYTQGISQGLSRADNKFSGTVSGLSGSYNPGDSVNISFIANDTDGYLTGSEFHTQINLAP